MFAHLQWSETIYIEFPLCVLNGFYPIFNIKKKREEILPSNVFETLLYYDMVNKTTALFYVVEPLVYVPKLFDSSFRYSVTKVMMVLLQMYGHVVLVFMFDGRVPSDE